MVKALWFLIKPALVMVGILTLCYPVLLFAYWLFGNNSILFSYVQGFFLLYDIILGICAAQAVSTYAPLALSFGVTRRKLRGAMALFWVALPVVCMALDFLCNSATTRLLSPEINTFFINLVRYPLHGLGFKLLLCGGMLWLGTLEFSQISLWKRILAILLAIVIYLQITVFMFVASLVPAILLTVYSLLLGGLGVLFAAIALHRMQALTLTQV